MGASLLRTVFLFVFAIWVFAAPAAAAVDVAASVDSPRIGLEDQLTYSIVIRGGGGTIPRPEPPALDSFTIFSAGSSSSLSIVNGRMRSTAKFTYVMVPHATGTFTIPPVDIRIKGRTYRTDPVTVEVLDQDSYVRQAPAAAPPVARPPATRQPRALRARPSRRPALRPGEREGGDVFVRAWVDTDDAYVNEQIVLTYTVYTRVEASIKGFAEDPKLTGFWMEEFPPEKKLKRGRAKVGGIEYVTADVRTVALFPTSSGTFVIEPGTLQGHIRIRQRYDDVFVDSFFTRWGRTLTRSVGRMLPTRPIEIVVKDFPEAGRPADFGGAVGDFDITAEVDVKEVEENEPVTLKVKIFGEGNIQGINEPQWPDLAEEFKDFDSGSSTDISTFEQRVIGEKTYEKLLIPQKAGTYKIPPVAFSYFDPVKGKYETIRTSGFTLKVKPGPEEEEVSATARPFLQQKEVEFLARDIQYIRQDLGRLRPVESPFYNNRLYWGLNVLPLLLFIGALVWIRRKEHLGSNPAYARLLRARREAARHLRDAKQCMARSDEKGFYASISRLLRQFVGDKINLPTAGLSVDSVARHLRERGVREEIIRELQACLDACDQARFTPAGGAPERMQEIYRNAGELIRQLERKL